MDSGKNLEKKSAVILAGVGSRIVVDWTSIKVERI